MWIIILHDGANFGRYSRHLISFVDCDEHISLSPAEWIPLVVNALDKISNRYRYKNYPDMASPLSIYFLRAWCVYVCLSVCTYVFLCVSVCLCLSVCTYVYVSVCLCLCMYACVHVNRSTNSCHSMYRDVWWWWWVWMNDMEPFLNANLILAG